MWGWYNQGKLGKRGHAMSDQSTFGDFVRRIRAGDQTAAAELVHRYEPLIRREVRLRLEDQRLGRLFDSMDVCQSVLASFFLRTAAGEYDLDEPGQLVGLLVKMARNKLASAARRQSQQKRDHRRACSGQEELQAVAAAEDSPTAGERVGFPRNWRASFPSVGMKPMPMMSEVAMTRPKRPPTTV